MRQELREQERLIKRKRQIKRKKKILQGIFTVILCIITFLGGRASAEVDDNQNLNSLQEPYKLVSGISDTLENTELKAQETDVQDSEQKNQDDKKNEVNKENKENDEDNIIEDKSESDNIVWNLRLVNKSYPIPDGFNVSLVQLKNGQSFDERAYPDLQEMLDAARDAGLSPYICSSYRSMEKQTTLYNNQVKKYKTQGYSEEDAKAEAGKWVAVPGTSEHQIGLAVDIVSQNYQVLDRQQANTAEQLWLMEHCYQYGFILRYPEDKSDITGIGYEPWHYRYVGKEAAAEIKEKGICLEEYLNRYK